MAATWSAYGAHGFDGLVGVVMLTWIFVSVLSVVGGISGAYLGLKLGDMFKPGGKV